MKPLLNRGFTRHTTRNFGLGSAGIAGLVNPRWTTVKLMLQVEALMVALMLIACVRARAEFDTSQPSPG